jgi:hypothetical protein
MFHRSGEESQVSRTTSVRYKRKLRSDVSVVLKGPPVGPHCLVASTKALRLLWRLEEKGYIVGIVAGQVTLKSPTGTLTKEQVETIKGLHNELRAIVRYVEGCHDDV